MVITFASTPVTVGTTTAGSNGGISTSVKIPADATPGEHTITASGPAASGGTLALRATIVVTGPATPLAFTGSSSVGPELWIGMGAVAVGSLFVVGGRRRSRATVSARS
ncbi:MAG: hypothetical protein WDA60_19015 [Acidimicrobiia bacterium]